MYGSQTTTDPASSVATGVAAIIVLVVAIAVYVLFFVAAWKMFRKAGRPGWAAIIPFYNLYVLLKMCGRPGWWLILWCIPFVNILISIVVAVDLAKAFGKNIVFGILGLWVFTLIGVIMLGFGDYEYIGSGGPAGDQPAPVAPLPLL